MMTTDSDYTNNDFEFARRTYYDILTKGSEAMEDMMEVAKASEHPRAFEVLATTMRTLADVNGSLLDLHKKKKDLTASDAVALPPAGTTNNNVFVGSTTELQQMLMNKVKDVTPEE